MQLEKLLWRMSSGHIQEEKRRIIACAEPWLEVMQMTVLRLRNLLTEPYRFTESSLVKKGLSFVGGKAFANISASWWEEDTSNGSIHLVIFVERRDNRFQCVLFFHERSYFVQCGLHFGYHKRWGMVRNWENEDLAANSGSIVIYTLKMQESDTQLRKRIW